MKICIDKDNKIEVKNPIVINADKGCVLVVKTTDCDITWDTGHVRIHARKINIREKKVKKENEYL